MVSAFGTYRILILGATMRRREFIGLGGSGTLWPPVAADQVIE
jgi:hypothetical protein